MMLKKICSAILAALLLQAAAAPAFANANPKKEAERAEKVQAQLSKLGTGRDALVRVELRDKTKLEGYVSEAGADTFTVTDAKGNATAVPYHQVKKAQGNNLSTGAKIAIGASVAAAVVLIVLYSMYAANER
jgi:preprotein translocase subunit SecF